ncbi:MAG TPA: beta-ketoacyl-ACP synthase II [Chloroflexota bacterium]|nr:beta-ketoacyl-ACP synthase II [Chloroflexota bacterium]
MAARVAITGLGLVTPLGLDVPTTWSALVEGRSGVGPISRWDASGLDTRIAGEIKGFDPNRYFDRKEARRLDRFSQLAIAASREALDDAGWEIGPENAGRIGVIIGTGIGGIETLAQQFQVFFERGPGRLSPFLTTMMPANMAAGHVSIYFGARGPTFCIASACASGAHAVGEAAELIRCGRATAMLAGGADASVIPIVVGAFNAAHALSTRNDEPERASRPFDRDRDGFVPAEAGGILLLENLEHARARGATVHAEIVGYGATADASHVTAPPEGGTGAAEAMRIALADAGLAPADIDYINAHGTSTQLNDRAETRAIKAVFGEAAYRVPISSSKSMTGHLLGAAGSVEAAIAALVIRNGVIPPTINLENPDPECDLDFVPGVARRARVRTVLSNSLGFGGQNACLILREYAG